MNCKYCNSEITKEQNDCYYGCCDGICENRYKNIHKQQYCKLCGMKITEEDNRYYGGFCSGGCAGEYDELRRERESCK